MRPAKPSRSSPNARHFASQPATHTNSFGLGETGRYRTHVWDYAGISSIGASRSDELAMHPTVKHVTLIADAIRDCSKRGEIVLDGFGGSGSTLVAAEETGRCARLTSMIRSTATRPSAGGRTTPERGCALPAATTASRTWLTSGSTLTRDRLDEALQRRAEAQENVSYYAEIYRKTRNEDGKAGHLEDWHWEQRMFDIINDAVSERYRAKLENRSYREGASRPGAALEELRASRKLRDEYVG